MDQTPLNMRPNKTRCREDLVKTKTEKDGESNVSPNDSSIENGSQTNSASQYPPISIIFVLFWIIGIISFGEYLFVSKINNEILNENKNENVDCQFVNVFENDQCDNFCNQLSCSMDISHTATKFNNNGGDLSPQNNISEYIFGIGYNMIFQTNNESFMSRCWTMGAIPQPRIAFNQNGIGKARINIVDCIFGIGLCDNKNEGQIYNGMCV